MYRQVYQERRTYLRYDDQHVIGYLNEEVINNYQPEFHGEDEDAPDPWPTAYA